MQQNHSPTPWRWDDRHQRHTYENLGGFVDATGQEVCNFGNNETYYPTAGSDPSVADREFILSAVNSHDDLLKLCKLASSFSFLVRTGAMNPERAVEAAGNLETKLQAAITKAEGEPCHPEN